MSFHINLGEWRSVFAVPSQVVDRDLKIAGVYQLKVLLYILRHTDGELSYEHISKELNIHQNDVKDSIAFWIDRGLLAQTDDEISPPPSASYQEQETIQREETSEQSLPKEPEKSQRLQPRPLTRPPRPGIQFVSQRLSENPALSSLMDEAQTSLQKPLSSGDICTLYMLYDTYGLPLEVILMLIEYSVSIGKANMHFIEKEGVRWSDEGIDGIERAEEKITFLKNRFSAWGTVTSIFGIKSAGSPTKAQLAFADCWLNEWKFSHEMLREAYERCVDSKGVCDLKYINGILKNWLKKDIKNPEDIAVKDALAPRVDKDRPFEKKSGASYDINDLDGTSFFDDDF